MSSQLIWLVKQGFGLFASDEDAETALMGIEEGECTAWELIGVREPESFRKYWAMCAHIAKHVRQIEIDRIKVDGRWQSVYKRILDREDVSGAIKLGVGLYIEHPVGCTDYAVREVKSLKWNKMTPAQWEEYVRRVAPFVQKKIMPEVRDPNAQDELLRFINKWLREIEREGAREQAA